MKALSSPGQRYICVHGHFYQPPRENPWLETVEVQDSAAPYHDWNERITSECYAPNGASRITNKQQQIIRIVNNYARMSFNFGPTLLSWLEEFAPRTYRMILDADQASAERYSGHGSALAQVYNHIIMPLASERDARTQIRWGIRDFEHRFRRRPEGMWLAETAVNRKTLDLLAQEGIRFTVLAPHQCARVRRLVASGAVGAGGMDGLKPVPFKAGAVEGRGGAGEQEGRGGAGEKGGRGGAGEADPSATHPNEQRTLAGDPGAPQDDKTNKAQDDDANKVQDDDANKVQDDSVGEGASAGDGQAEGESKRWTEAPDASVDPTHPYVVQLDEGRSIAVFFYDGPGSRAIAFESLLNDGETFGRRLLAGLHSHKAADEPQLAHVATDGESYGHHHKHGEMALSYALHWIEENQLAKLTNYGEFLERFPPKWEAEVVEDSSWSCSHGVERWRADCGCNGGKVGYNQRWRAPLREALDLLRDGTAPLAERVAAPLLHDVWAARDAYINVVLDRSADNLDRFLATHARRTLTAEERVRVFELMEMERHTQLMYTSCGWFFDEISGIETVQIIAYAGRVLQLAASLSPRTGEGSKAVAKLEAAFLKKLGEAKSNVAEMQDGAEVYRRFVTAGRLDLENVGAHYAISSMFKGYPDGGSLFCFDVKRHSYDVLTSGRGRFALGRAALKSRVTEETEEICFAVLHLGDQNLSAAVKRYAAAEDAGAWERFVAAGREAIRRANLPELIRLIDGYFGGTVYSLTSLFADEQHRILKGILNQTLAEVESSLMRIYEEHATLLDFLGEANVAAPPALALTAGFAINASLRHALEAETFETGEIMRLLRRAEIDHVTLDAPLLSFTADRRMKRAMVRLESAVETQSVSVLNETLAIAESLGALPMDVNLWGAQNIWNDLLQRSDSTYWSREWREGFRKIGRALNVSVDDLVVERGVRGF